MKRVWPIIAVADVQKSAAWYARLLDARQTHPGATVFDQIVDGDDTTLLCLHHWGPSGPRGDHHWTTLMKPSPQGPGTGLLLWFVVDDFDAAWRRATALKAQYRQRYGHAGVRRAGSRRVSRGRE